jgi:hypothetical membrane protein
MERFAQYLDSLEDLYFAILLKQERVREIAAFAFFMVASAALQLIGILIALRHPPLAMGIGALLLVGTLFRAVVGPHDGPQATTV